MLAHLPLRSILMLRSTRKAFTLIELIVVIVILGILALIAIPTFAKVIAKSKLAGLRQTAASTDRNAVALGAFEQSAATDANYTDAVGEVKDAKVTVTKLTGGTYEFKRDSICVILTPSAKQGVPGTVATDASTCVAAGTGTAVATNVA